MSVPLIHGSENLYREEALILIEGEEFIREMSWSRLRVLPCSPTIIHLIKAGLDHSLGEERDDITPSCSRSEKLLHSLDLSLVDLLKVLKNPREVVHCRLSNLLHRDAQLLDWGGDNDCEVEFALVEFLACQELLCTVALPRARFPNEQKEKVRKQVIFLLFLEEDTLSLGITFFLHLGFYNY